MKKSTLCLCLVLVFSLIFGPMAMCGEISDEFSAPQLNEEIWVILKAGDASYNIKDGKLILTSPKPTDGIILYYNQEVKDPGFFLEVRVDSSGIIDSGYVTTTKVMTPPEESNTYNPLRLGQFRLKPDSWRIRDENIETILDGKVTGMHTYKIELGNDTLKFYFEDKEVAEIPKVAESRFFSISPDPYADDYSGELIVEYIKVSAPWIIAVEPGNKLAVTWGIVKSRT